MKMPRPTRLTFMFALLLALVVTTTNRALVFANQARNQAPSMPGVKFKPGDFARSAFAPVRENHQHLQYQRWAADTANDVMAGFLKGKDPGHLLEKVANARNELACKQFKCSTVPDFGRVLSAADRPWSSLLGTRRIGKEGKGRGGQKGGNSLALALEEISRRRVKQTDLFGYEGISTPNKYTTVDGLRIAASHLLIGKPYTVSSLSVKDLLKDPNAKARTKTQQEFSVLHPEQPSHSAIFTDVLKRLTLLQSTSLTLAEKKDHFLRALYGYHNAYHFRRGGCSIGDVFFAGVYRSLFGGAGMPFEDGIDRAAMILREGKFIKRYQSALIK